MNAVRKPKTESSSTVLNDALSFATNETMSTGRFWAELAVNTAYYAAFVTFGLMGVTALALVIPSVILSNVFFIFGIVMVIYGSLYVAGKVTPPTMLAFDAINSKAKSIFASLKSKTQDAYLNYTTPTTVAH